MTNYLEDHALAEFQYFVILSLYHHGEEPLLSPISHVPELRTILINAFYWILSDIPFAYGPANPQSNTLNSNKKIDLYGISHVICLVAGK